MAIRFVLLMILVFTSTSIYFSKDNYVREDYKYNHKKARKILIAYFDPYSGELIYEKDQLEIDHIVPLSLAHDLGGYLWNDEAKRNFANDLENLIMVSKKCNRAKGNKSLVEWLPKNERFHSEYRQKYNYILKKYEL